MTLGPLREMIDLETALQLLPKTSAAFNNSNISLSKIKPKQALVFDPPTLQEVMDAQRTGEKINLSYLTGFGLYLLGGNYNSDPAEFLVGKPGSRESAFMVREESAEVSLHVTSVTVQRLRNDAFDEENWSFQGYKYSVYGSGYYEELKRYHMSFECVKGQMTFVMKD